MNRVCQVRVFGISEEETTIDLCSTEEQLQKMTVLELRQKIAARFPGQGVEDLRMIFTDKTLDDDSSELSQYGVHHGCIIRLVVRVPGGLTA